MREFHSVPAARNEGTDRGPRVSSGSYYPLLPKGCLNKPSAFPPGLKRLRSFCAMCGTLRLRSGQAIEAAPIQNIDLIRDCPPGEARFQNVPVRDCVRILHTSNAQSAETHKDAIRIRVISNCWHLCTQYPMCYPQCKLNSPTSENNS